MSKGLDRLFGGEAPVSPAGTATENVAPPGEAEKVSVLCGTCRDLPIAALVDMDQPFRLYGKEEMDEMVKSISQHGVIQRLIVRPYGDGQYQIISGRNRRTGARLAGYSSVPCEIRALNDNEAELQMIATNLDQRKDLLPSERAWAYRRRLEAMKRQGQRVDLTLPQGAARCRSDDELGRELNVSGDTVWRYTRLSYLVPELLEQVDNRGLGLVAGVSLSFLDVKSQELVHKHFFQDRHDQISKALAERIRQAAEVSVLTEEGLAELLSSPKTKPKTVKNVSAKPFRKFFPKNTSQEVMQKTLMAALKLYFEAGHRIVEK